MHPSHNRRYRPPRSRATRRDVRRSRCKPRACGEKFSRAAARAAWSIAVPSRVILWVIGAVESLLCYNQMERPFPHANEPAETCAIAGRDCQTAAAAIAGLTGGVVPAWRRRAIFRANSRREIELARR